MKAIRIVQVIVLVLLAVYVAIFHAANPETVRLPGLISMPVAFVAALAMVVAWFTAWLPARLKIWRLERKLTTIRSERDRLLDELQLTGPGSGAPIIPDRVDPHATSNVGSRRGDDPSDYL